MIGINPFSIMMICGKCKGQIPDNSNFCSRCGAKVDKGPPIPNFSIGIRFDLPDEQAITNLIEILNLKLARVGNKTEIISALTAAERAGAGINQFTTIFRTFADISERDAETCMRTWSTQAYNKAAWQRAKEYAPYKEWLPAIDSRTRASHLAMKDVIIEVDEPFDVPAIVITKNKRIPACQMMYPGDPSLGAPLAQIIQCRCALAPRFLRKGK